MGDLDKTFWADLYKTGGDGWELGRAAPPLETWAAGESLAGQRALVPGCGRGHEARMLARRGAIVTAIDLTDDAIAAARALGDEGIDFRVGDLFALPPSGEFDLSLEHTCFCAIDPARRDDYVRTIAGALRPSGQLVGLFYAHGRPGGPPFDVTADEIRARFGARFDIVTLEPAQGSIARREGQELFVRMVRR